MPLRSPFGGRKGISVEGAAEAAKQQEGEKAKKPRLSVEDLRRREGTVAAIR